MISPDTPTHFLTVRLVSGHFYFARNKLITQKVYITILHSKDFVTHKHFIAQTFYNY